MQDLQPFMKKPCIQVEWAHLILSHTEKVISNILIKAVVLSDLPLNEASASRIIM
ncbi:MAG: hypothetical protein ACJAWV_003252 [Flammeovirgaceae bacterium]|jgi:hypothetical protein